MQSVTLSNGVKMPVIGYGTLQITDPAQCRQCVGNALACGYRLVDTAAAYGNERAVGDAIKTCGVPPGRAVYHHQALGAGCRI